MVRLTGLALGIATLAALTFVIAADLVIGLAYLLFIH
jgi:hypothetical protein